LDANEQGDPDRHHDIKQLIDERGLNRSLFREPVIVLADPEAKQGQGNPPHDEENLRRNFLHGERPAITERGRINGSKKLRDTTVCCIRERSRTDIAHSNAYPKC
jgi:hypothetical protein